MVVRFVIKYIKDLNKSLPLNGISKELSPGVLLTGDSSPDFNRMNALNFGDHAQSHQHNKPTNIPKTRNVGGITLHPSVNEQ